MRKFLPILLLVLVIFPILAFAQTNPCQITSGAVTAPNALPKCVNQIYVWSLGVAALLALLMIVLGGYYYMTSSGNAEQATKGVEMIWASIIGLALLFGAYLLLNTINPDLVDFNANSVNCLTDPTAAGCPQLTPSTTPSNIRATP